MAVAALIPAAGYGTRMKSTQNKQFMLLMEKPVLVHTLELFSANPLVKEIIVITRDDEIEYCTELISQYGIPRVKAVVAGGKERQHSVWNGLQHVSEECQTVAVHDGARPLLFPNVLNDVLELAAENQALVVGVPVKDTIKVVGDDGIVKSTPKRNELWAIQTPQVFSRELLIAAYKNAWENNVLATDDAALVEAMQIPVTIVEGSYENIKITTPEDLLLAEAFMSRRERS